MYATKTVRNNCANKILKVVLTARPTKKLKLLTTVSMALLLQQLAITKTLKHVFLNSFQQWLRLTTALHWKIASSTQTPPLMLVYRIVCHTNNIVRSNHLYPETSQIQKIKLLPHQKKLFSVQTAVGYLLDSRKRKWKQRKRTGQPNPRGGSEQIKIYRSKNAHLTETNTPSSLISKKHQNCIYIPAIICPA